MNDDDDFEGSDYEDSEYGDFSMGFDDEHGFNSSVSDEFPGEPVIRIYSAGPLTNNDEDIASECGHVRAILQKVFGNYDYQGVRFEIYNPGEFTMPGSDHSADDVYAINYEQCVLADVVFYHVTVPSLGVGCESQIAANATVPRVVLARTDTKVSRMFEGTFSSTLATIRFENRHDLELQLREQREQIASDIINSAKKRRTILIDFSAESIGKTIFRQRIRNQITLSELAKETDCKADWLRRLEVTPSLAPACSVMELLRIASATQCNLKLLSKTAATLEPQEDTLSEPQKRSLDNLVTYASVSKCRDNESRLFGLWDDYLEVSAEEELMAAEFREGHDPSLTVEDWSARDVKRGLF